MTSFMSGNRLSLLRNGVEFFPALRSALDRAETEIHLQTYIFVEDAAGQEIAEGLKRAARRGVRTYLLLDGFGCKGMSEAFLQSLREAKVRVVFYRPELTPWRFRKSHLHRMHWKLAVIDGCTAFVGGINIIDDLNTPKQKPPRVDYAVSVAGSLVPVIHSAVQEIWNRECLFQFQETLSARPKLPGVVMEGVSAALVIRDNAWHRRDIEHAYLAAITQAQHEIIIANCYFLPGIRFRHALLAAVQRGVRVIIVVQSRIEFVLPHYALRALYGQFLSGGVEVYEYHDSFMHSKVAVIDQHWATVGSSNIDPFSLLLSREANIVVKDASFAQALHADLIRGLTAKARLVRAKEWGNTPWQQRFVSWVAYGALRVLAGWVGYRF